MEVHEDFTSKKLTLVFDDGRREELTRQQSKEFEEWVIKKKRE